MLTHIIINFIYLTRGVYLYENNVKQLWYYIYVTILYLRDDIISTWRYYIYVTTILYLCDDILYQCDDIISIHVTILYLCDDNISMWRYYIYVTLYYIYVTLYYIYVAIYYIYVMIYYIHVKIYYISVTILYLCDDFISMWRYYIYVTSENRKETRAIELDFNKISYILHYGILTRLIMQRPERDLTRAETETLETLVIRGETMTRPRRLYI